MVKKPNYTSQYREYYVKGRRNCSINEGNIKQYLSMLRRNYGGKLERMVTIPDDVMRTIQYIPKTPYDEYNTVRLIDCYPTKDGYACTIMTNCNINPNDGSMCTVYQRKAKKKHDGSLEVQIKGIKVKFPANIVVLTEFGPDKIIPVMNTLLNSCTAFDNIVALKLANAEHVMYLKMYLENCKRVKIGNSVLFLLDIIRIKDAVSLLAIVKNSEGMFITVKAVKESKGKKYISMLGKEIKIDSDTFYETVNIQ